MNAFSITLSSNNANAQSTRTSSIFFAGIASSERSLLSSRNRYSHPKLTMRYGVASIDTIATSRTASTGDPTPDSDHPERPSQASIGTASIINAAVALGSLLYPPSQQRAHRTHTAF
eukprot:Plantae.Rhodophyta-Purpureofilum_apyrenoidigerum.ctg15458.p1 GENE.Plantae.Rhodophyta-Purpureofilum_apyrenoidigerum.ctg15458~~Plantae.Rhodophyta-Purpureofilum_apyrenoidigerum.ctg15458.p1  ORF type:complete len:117 (-),score=3.06 Plantae.Rhodophyta-Purpureofilum_apyrenoidigerum.ctg15458:543-893(-)